MCGFKRLPNRARSRNRDGLIGVRPSRFLRGDQMAKRIIYLIHFTQAYWHARHYLGSTDNLAARIEAHRSGNGARLMEVITAAGIDWQVVRTWAGSRQVERRIKNRKEAPALCPVCSGEKAMRWCVNPAKGR